MRSGRRGVSGALAGSRRIRRGRGRREAREAPCSSGLFGTRSAVCRGPAVELHAAAARRGARAHDVGEYIAVAGEERLGRAHLGAERQLAFGQPVAAVLLELGLAHVLLRTAGAEGALVHLAAHAEGAGLRELRRAEGAGVKAVAAADAHVLVVQHHAFGRLIDAAHGAYGDARRVGAVHAGDRDRFLARHALVQRHHPAAVDAPGHLVFVLARDRAGVAIDAALGVAEKSHSRHRSGPRDLAEAGFRLLHHGHGVVAVGPRGVRRLARDVGNRALRVLVANVLALPPAGEVIGQEHDAAAYAPRHTGAYFDARARGRRHPDVVVRLHAAVVGVSRVDVAEHLLLQLGEPDVRARLVAAALVLDQAAACHHQRELGAVVGGLLDRPVECRQAPEGLLVVVGRVLLHQVGPRRVQRLAMHGNRVGEVPHHAARAGVAERRAAVLDGDADDAARDVGAPALALRARLLGGRELAPPAELLEQHRVELRIAGGDLRAGRRRAVGREHALPVV